VTGGTNNSRCVVLIFWRGRNRTKVQLFVARRGATIDFRGDEPAGWFQMSH
jgi:hypothetical protein